jgi:hypothetical protein
MHVRHLVITRILKRFSACRPLGSVWSLSLNVHEVHIRPYETDPTFGMYPLLTFVHFCC